MASDLSCWSPRSRPERRSFEGRYVRLEPLDADRHGMGLFDASSVPDAQERFRWLPEPPPLTESAFLDWAGSAARSEDPMFFAIIDLATNRVAGRQAFMRIDTRHGVVEIGNIYLGPLLARRRGGTEALYLAMRHVFDELGYRRLEWKCNDRNEPSRHAAARLGFIFEGVFRQHMVLNGQNRDTAWFAIVDEDWPGLKAGLEDWLAPGNFDAEGRQLRRLKECVSGARAASG